MKRLALILAVLYTCAAFGLTLGFTKALNGWALGRPFTVQGYTSGATYVIADGDNSAKFIMTDAGDVWNVGFGALTTAGAILPDVEDTRNIGAPGNRFHWIYAEDLTLYNTTVSSALNLDGPDATVGTTTQNSIWEELYGNYWDAGASANKWVSMSLQTKVTSTTPNWNFTIWKDSQEGEVIDLWKIDNAGAMSTLIGGANIGSSASGADDNELCAGIADAGAYSLQGVTAYLSGDLTVQGGDLIGTTGTLNLFNGLSTTVNAFGAATVLNEGSSTCVHTLGGSLANNGTLRSGSVLTGTATGAKAQYSKTETNTVHESGDPVTVRVTVNNAGDVTWSWGYRNTAGSVVVITGAFSATFTTLYTCPESLKSFWFYPDNASDPNTNVVMTINTGYLNVVGAATIAGRLVTTPSADTAITAAGGITAMNRFMIVHGSGGAIDITANPQIADGIHGQELYVIGYHEANTVKLETGTGCLGAGGTLGAGDVLHYMYDAALDVWIQLGPLQNN